MDILRSLAAWVGVGLTLCGLSLACAPSAPAVPPTPTVDAFAVVRATAQSAYASGKAHLDRAEYLQACVDLDVARTNDPESRPEIQQALEEALQHCLTPPPEATAPRPAAPQRTVVVATLPPLATPAPAAVTPAPQAAAATPAAKPTSAAALTAWSDPQGRFSIGAPTDWTRIEQPQTLFGKGVVAFRDPSSRAEIDIAVDGTTKAVSPELYSASIELAMQQQMPGYATEQVMPGSMSGNPSLRRTFTFTQKDAAGQDHQARGIQVTVVKGSTPYIIAASAPAEQFQQYSGTFEQILGSFRFT
jgi:hypothetical protein